MSRGSRRHSGRRRRSKGKVLPPINVDAAGIDIGSAFHMVAVPPDRAEQPIRRFESYTPDLYAAADWLKECGIETVAMESTGVFWIPLYELLEERGFEVLLVNAHHVKNVPGRKSDVQDCEWIRQLHTFGLLRGSFRPGQEFLALRAYLRQREALVKMAATAVQHMQKALSQMNLQLHNAVSDITGHTGMAILRAIIAGEHDPQRLAAHRNYRCHASTDEIVRSLTGNYRPEHLFALRQAVELYDVYQAKMTDCDQAVEAALQTLCSQAPPVDEPPPPPRTNRPPRHNQPNIELRLPLYNLLGVDLTQIPGINQYTAVRIVSEIGLDMSRWPSAKHFTSWATLAPRNQITGGKLISSKTQSSANRIAHLLRLAAQSVSRTQTALGAFNRRIAARATGAEANTATARKIAEQVYCTIKYHRRYVDPGPHTYDQRHRARVLRNMTKRATALGYKLVPIEQEPQPAMEAVS